MVAAPDLGSGVFDVWVRVPSSAQKSNSHKMSYFEN